MKRRILILLIVLMSLLILVVGCENAEKTTGNNEVSKSDESPVIDDSPSQAIPSDTPDTAVKSETESASSEDVDSDDASDHDHSLCKAVGYDYVDDELHYNLVWSDEFDYEGLPDESKWGYDVGGHGWGNRELQYYTEGENADVADGVLTITARKEDYLGSDYTSTRLISKNKGDWLYGRIDVRAKLPSGRGTWPAIWMLPTEWKYGNWPNSGEIDIMEHVGFSEGEIHGTIHTESYNHMKGTQIGKSLVREDAIDAFYTYSVEWLPDKLKFYIDDKLYFVYKPSNLISCPDEGEWPFDQSFHLLLNIAVGGSWGGAQGIDDDIFPQEMVIDYVRVYQADEFLED